MCYMIKHRRRAMLKKIMIGLLIIVVLAFSVNLIFNNVIYTTFRNTVVPLDPFTNYPLAKDYGLRPNDESSANFNADLFKAAVEQFGGIIVDDRYYISRVSRMYIEKAGIIGDSDLDSELVLTGESNYTMFDSGSLKELYISDVTFTNNTDNVLLMVYSSDVLNEQVDSIIIKNSEFYGNISAYRVVGAFDSKPNVRKSSISYFEFDNNIVKNTDYTFIKIPDVPYGDVRITNNEIENFKYIFANFEVKNGNRFEEDVFASRQNLHVSGNTVTSTDDWWADADGNIYYTFVLAEGENVVYDNNHVEGLKSQGDVALYDAYLSCNNVLYTNNVWKNNISFFENKKNNVFMKSKQGTKPLVRTYTGNTFLIEESFAEKYGYDPSRASIYFMSLEAPAASYNISDNSFVGYDIKFQTSSRMIRDFTFNNNTIETQKASGVIAYLRVNDDLNRGSIQFSNNNIKIGNYSTDNNSADESVVMMRFSIRDDAKNNDKMILEAYNNNNLQGPFKYFFYRANQPHFDLSVTGDATSNPVSEEPSAAETYFQDIYGNNYTVLDTMYNRFHYNSSSDVGGLVE